MIVVDASALVNGLLRRCAHAAIWQRIKDEGAVAAPHLIDVEVGHALRRLLLRNAEALGVLLVTQDQALTRVPNIRTTIELVR